MLQTILSTLSFSDIKQFFSDGGFFMWALLVTSLVSGTVIAFKFLTLRRELIVPQSLANELGDLDPQLDDGGWSSLSQRLKTEASPLARLAVVAIENEGKTPSEAQEAVQSSAREEIVKMNSCLSVLEVVITIAPLLGLLGTTSGLVVVFEGIGSSAEDQGMIAKGIARALTTTIVGIAIAVPSVMAYSYFSRQIETISVRLEVLLGRLVSRCQKQSFPGGQ